MGKGDRGAPQSWGMRHWWLEVRGYRWWFHLESLGLASRGLVSDPQLNDLLWNLLGRGGVWGYSYLLDSIMFCPLGREGLTPDSLTQPPVLSLESILPPPSQGHPEGPMALISLGEVRSFHPREEYWGPSQDQSGIWNPNGIGCILDSGLDPGQQYHLGGGDLD